MNMSERFEKAKSTINGLNPNDPTAPRVVEGWVKEFSGTEKATLLALWNGIVANTRKTASSSAKS